jgi:diguanylate cyclase (GGDEF)-like protein
MAGILASLIMQVTGFKDFRETLWMHHCILVLLLLYSAFLLIAEKRSYGWNSKMKITVFCIALCGLGTAGDLITYYRDANQSTSFAMMGLLFYILALGVSSLAEVRKWITMGKQASDYRELAYHDQLTGVYNRNAYAKAVAAEGFHPEGYGVVMLDLNCLKECNDVHGHDKGDIYICDSAGLIEETFGRKGNVYRMGGDEFCVLLEQATQEECASYKKQLQKLCEQYNRENDQPFTMQIACGFQIYDKDRDFDISDTLRRADHRMYAHKLHLKQMNQAKRAIS